MNCFILEDRESISQESFSRDTCGREGDFLKRVLRR